MKKQIKDLTEGEVLKNINNEKVLAIIGIGNIFKCNAPETLSSLYDLMKKTVELLEKEIEVDE